LGLIDPEDDSLPRFIVWHYHYVERHHERKLEAISAYSTRVEAYHEFNSKSNDLLKRQEAGLADIKEYFSCGYQGPGGMDQSMRARLTQKIMRSGWTSQGLSKDQTNGKPDSEVNGPK
jgi:hypothetical protein